MKQILKKLEHSKRSLQYDFKEKIDDVSFKVVASTPSSKEKPLSMIEEEFETKMPIACLHTFKEFDKKLSEDDRLRNCFVRRYFYN